MTSWMRRCVGVVAITAMAAGVLTGCGGSSSESNGNGDSKGPYKIGVALALSGPAASWGLSSRNAVVQAVKNLNENGGINGREIKLYVKDTKTDPTEAARVGAVLINQDQVMAIIGGTTSSGTLAFLPLAGRQGVTVLSPGADPAIGGDPSKPYFPTTFRITAPVTVDNQIIAEQIKKDGYKRIAIINQDDAYGVTGTDAFKENVAAQSGGATVVSTATLPLTATDASTQASKVLQAKPDAVYLIISSLGAAKAALRALSNAGFHGGLYGIGPLATNDILSVGKAAEGMVFDAYLNPSKPAEDAADLQKILEPAGGIKDFGSLVAVQAIPVLENALKSNPANGKELAKAIESAGTVKAYGRATFDYTPKDHNGLGANAMVVVQIKNGKFVRRSDD